MKTASEILTMAIMAQFAVTALHAADIAGQWEAEFDTAIGKQKYVYTLRRDGDLLAGRAVAEVGGQKRETELQQVKLAGDDLSFIELLNFQGNDLRIEYTGTVTAEGIRFTRKVGDFATEEFIAKRVAGTPVAPAQPAAAAARGEGLRRGPQGPAVTSPEVLSDRRMIFRLLAPQAESVRLVGGDIPGLGPGAAMTKGENGVWETTVGPIPPGAYRYNFNVGGISVIDPRSPKVSESNNNVWSLVDVPGSDFMDTRDVPHGAVASVTYYSKSLQKFRRLHVYTPPGYEVGTEKYPVFYLLHGASDSDDSWTSVGRAGFIMDNLIAANKAKPMIVVMPAGHTRATMPGGRRGGPGASATASRPPTDEFVEDFLNDIMPLVEKTYRVIADRGHRAIAGLSMGGSQTLNIAIPHLEKFAYIGVYSSGLIGGLGARRGGSTGGAAGPTWEEQHLDTLDNANLKTDLKLLWFSTGKDDRLISTTQSTVAMLKKHGFNPVFLESPGGHTWINWRNYLNEFAPQLFQ